jgi:murein L,D-transpeptidase YcbB/YkuD
VNDAKAWYSSRRKQYTPDIIKQIQEKVATEPDGLIGPLTIQAVADRPTRLLGRQG